MSSIKIISINTITANVPPSAAASGSSMKIYKCMYITITRCTGMWPHSYCMHTTLLLVLAIYICNRKLRHECNNTTYVHSLSEKYYAYDDFPYVELLVVVNFMCIIILYIYPVDFATHYHDSYY